MKSQTQTFCWSIAVIASFFLGSAWSGKPQKNETTTSSVATATGLSMPPEYQQLLNRFLEVADNNTSSSLTYPERNFFQQAVDEYASECLFSVTPQNKTWCHTFNEALTRFNDRSDRERISHLFEKG